MLESTKSLTMLKLFQKKTKAVLSDLNINFLGKKSSPDIAELLLGSNFFIHASYIENSPNSVCEAMISGTPVIAGQVGGVGSLIKHDETGWMFQEGDFTMLAGMISNLKDDKERVLMVAENGKKNRKKKT